MLAAGRICSRAKECQFNNLSIFFSFFFPAVTEVHVKRERLTKIRYENNSDKVLTFHISLRQFSKEVTPESGLDLSCSGFLLIVRGTIHPSGWYCGCALDVALVCH